MSLKISNHPKKLSFQLQFQNNRDKSKQTKKPTETKRKRPQIIDLQKQKTISSLYQTESEVVIKYI